MFFSKTSALSHYSPLLDIYSSPVIIVEYLNITIITETEVTNYFSKMSDLKENMQTILNSKFNAMSSPNPLKLSSRFDSFQKYTYSQT